MSKTRNRLSVDFLVHFFYYCLASFMYSFSHLELPSIDQVSETAILDCNRLISKMGAENWNKLKLAKIKTVFHDLPTQFWPLLCSDGVHRNSFVKECLLLPNRPDLFVKVRAKNAVFGTKALTSRWLAIRSDFANYSCLSTSSGISNAVSNRLHIHCTVQYHAQEMVDGSPFLLRMAMLRIFLESRLWF